ncbi:MAG: hypothetical protein ACI87J_000428 [Colwellia sp.]|jgi:hypothetical protein
MERYEKGIHMKYKSLKTCAAVLLLLSCNLANAGLMVTNVDLTITGVSGNYSSVSVDDVFQFTAIYDDASTHMLNEDTQSLCLTTHVSSPGVNCASSHNPTSYNFFSNASLNFNMMFDTTALLNANGAFYDRHSHDREWTYQTASNGHLHFSQHDDTLTSGFTTANPGGSGATTLYYSDGHDNAQHTQIRWSQGPASTKAYLDVPEPSTLAIFALGMIGLASRRFKKQS